MRSIVSLISCLISLTAFGQAPVAYWTMNNTPADASGNNNHGVVHGNVKAAMDRFGNPCGAYHFDGISAYIEVPSSASLEAVTNAFTIAGWYRFDYNRGNNWLTLVCKGISNMEAPDNPQFRLQVQQNINANTVLCPAPGVSGSSTISMHTGFTACDQLFNNHLFEIGKWSFYALVYDGQRVMAYMNDVKVFELPYAGALAKSQSPLYIGMDEPGNTEYFEGSMDDVYIFDSALPEQEIKNLFTQSRTASTKEEFEMNSPGNQVFYLSGNSCTAKVNYVLPTVTQPQCGNVNLKQFYGPASRSNLTPGTYAVRFEAVSATGYEQTCSFNIIVKDSIRPRVAMPRDTVLYLKNGQGIRYSFNAPQASDNCAVKSVVQVQGPASGELFTPGKHEIKYRAADSYGNFSEASFNVEVVKDTVQAKLPPKVQSRKTTELKYFEVNSTKLKIRLYDRGVFDGDTVSIYLNNKVLLPKHEVTPKGYIFEITIEPGIDNELLFYAENLGTIPPNTAWRVIEDGDNRYEANVLSSLDTNATIRIRKKK